MGHGAHWMCCQSDLSSRSPALVRTGGIAVALLLLILVLTPYAKADVASLNLELLSPSEMDIETGGIVTASVQLLNETDEYTDFSVAAVGPDGWTCTAIPSEMCLEQGMSDVAFVTIAAPVTSPAGQHTVIIEAYPKDRRAESVSVEIDIAISPRIAIDIHPTRSENPDATTGDVIEHSFQVVNTGNVAVQVLLSVESVPSWRTETDPRSPEFYLEPGQTGNLTALVTVPDVLPNAVRHRLTVRASVIQPQSDIEPEVSATTYIIPERLSHASIYANLEGDVGVLGSWGDDEDFAMTVSAGPLAGYLGDDRTAIVSARNLLVHGDTSGTFIQAERISAEFFDESSGHIRGGDLLFDLGTPLMARYQHGRGGDVLARDGRREIRAFHYRTRGSTQIDNSGAQLAFYFNDYGELRITGIRDSEVVARDGNESRATTFGIFAGFEPVENAWLTGEMGNSRHPGDPGNGRAWRYSAEYGIENFSVNCEWLRAGDAFHGGWRDMELRRANMLWRLTSDVSVWSNFSLSWNNVTDDPDEQRRNRRNIGYGASWNIENLARLRFSHRMWRAWDEMLDDYDRHTDLMVYSLSRSWADMSTTVSWEEQTDEDNLRGEYEKEEAWRIYWAQRMGLRGSLRVGWSNGSVAYGHGTGSYNTRYFSLDGFFRVGHDLDLSFNVQRNSGGLLGSRTNAYGALSWEFIEDRELNFLLRSYSGLQDTNTEFAVEYTQPVSVPLGMFPVRGSVWGRLYMETEPQNGVRGARVSVGGQEILTGDDGIFEFPSVEPGLRELVVDTGSLEIGLVPAYSMPMQIEVEAGRTVEVSIPVVETGSVSGRVLVEDDMSMNPQLIMPDVVIELQKEDGIEYRRTNVHGQFSFSDLEPGRYVMLLRPENIPEDYELKGIDRYEFVLGTGESIVDMDFVIRPVPREIEVTTQVEEDK